MTDDREKALQELSDIGQEMQKAQDEYEAENDAWWKGLTEKEREDAFYAVVKRIHRAEILDKGSFRYALYQVFGFGPHMYIEGMNCGYMELHNSIFDYEYNRAMQNVDRLEVIDENGRSYVKYLKDQKPRYSLQDNNKTLKIFIDKVTRVKLKED